MRSDRGHRLGRDRGCWTVQVPFPISNFGLSTQLLHRILSNFSKPFILRENTAAMSTKLLG